MSLVCGKALWSIICGQSVLASDEVVGEELEDAAQHLQEGLSFYKSWSDDEYKSWCTTARKERHDYVYKIGTLLDVAPEQAWLIFQLFLQFEFRGSATQLLASTTSDREETSLMHQIFNFYICDPLHLLSCRRHILAADSSHPYEKLFKQYISAVLDPDQTLGTKLITQLRNMTAKLLPKSPPMSPHFPPNGTQARISFLLSAIKHQLATLLVYHGIPGKPCNPESIRALLTLAQGIGLGRDLIENVGRAEKNLFQSQLEAIDAFHCFLITLLINADSDPMNHILCSPEWVSRLNPMIHSLGSKPWHYPPILAWAILQGRRVANDTSCSAEEASRYSRLVQRAIKGNVFGYLQSSLNIAAFATDQLLKVIGASITYSLICIVGTCIDLEKIDLMPQVHQLSKVCLAFEPTSHFFWSEGGSEASVLLPTALESFPHSPSALLDILTALASADKFSAAKVVELLKELESFTWPLIVLEGSSLSVSGSLCVTRSDLYPLPGFIIPKDSHGTIMNIEAVQSVGCGRIVCWQMAVNGWHVLLSSFQLLLNQINSGAGTEAWSLDIVIRGLHLLSAILKSNLEHAFFFQEHQIVARQLFISISQILKPDYNLVAALLEFFSEYSKLDCNSLWNDLDGCALFPFLPKSRVGRRSSTDLLVNYKAGNIRALICGMEANSGNFSVLMHHCSLVEIAVKNGLNHNTIRGTIVFVVKEVVPVMLLWRCTDVSSRIELFECVFSLLHHVLENGNAEKDVQELVVMELSNAKGGAGSTLKSILESSANLQATLDQPAEWPHSSHARKLTKMAKLALSLAHRLVGQYLTSGERLREFFLEGSSLSVGRMTDGMWVSQKSPHLALTIAHFVYHRQNPRLPYLALRTLTRLAKEMSVPLVACLGSEAEGLRDTLLCRLDFDTEDMWVKVATLRLLKVSTLLQPGLIRLFLTPPGVLLDSVVALIQQQKESKNEAGTELLLSLVELVSSLWDNNLTIATTYLKGNEDFWDGLSFCLCNKEPGEDKDDISGGIFKIYALEFYGSQSITDSSDIFGKKLKKFVDQTSDKFSSWVKYVFLTYIEKKITLMDSNSEEDAEEGSSFGLLENFCQFLVIILTKKNDLLSDEQKNLVGVCVVESLLNLFENDVSVSDALQVLLAEIHLALLSHCSRIMVENPTYTSYLSRLLATLRSSVMQTRAKSQVMILAATLKALASPSTVGPSQELQTNLVSSSVLLVEQHCSLASSLSEETTSSSYDFSSSACLALACSLLHRCMESLSQDKIQNILESSHLTYALLQAAVKQTEMGNAMVVREVQRLLTLIARRTTRTNDLNTNSLAVSVSLVLASQKQFELSILRDLLWCTTYCLKKEGSSGLEGAVSLVAVHLTPITAALATPDTQPDLALAAASLAATLAPYHQLWRVIHQDCFEQLVTATASCIHRTVKMLHLKETLEREVCGEKKSNEVSSAAERIPHNITLLSQGTISLINQLLQILSTCLETIRYLSPDLTELLCCPGVDITSCTFDLIQPSIRRQTGEQITLPNLATLADVLDLFHTFVPKEGRYSSPMRNTRSTARVDLPLLTHCVEEALLLFITYSALLVLSPNIQVREARDIRTFLADETSSFFNHWIGRRAVAASSPLPPLSPKLPLSDLPYFILCRQVVSSLCNPTKT